MNTTAERTALVTLSLVSDMGPKRLRRLVEHFGSAEGVMHAPAGDLLQVEGIPRTFAERLAPARTAIDVQAEMALAEGLGVRIMTWSDPDYPFPFTVLDDRPPVVYIRGELRPVDAMGIAVVGTRLPTAYGRAAAQLFSREFSRAGFTTVSGLARGIDTEAHGASLGAGGRTVAVLGNGLNRHYPPENRKLEERIAANGALISEFPLNFGPDKGNFPRRNRLIAALGLATLVVEADVKSGALITAEFAVEQGKDVFAVPGPVFSRRSGGPHYLIRQGAYLAQEPDDVIEAVRPLARWMKKRMPAEPHAPGEAAVLDDVAQKIVAMLEQEGESLSIERLCAMLGCPAGRISASLLDLEMKGLVRGLPGKRYMKQAAFDPGT